MMSPDADHRSGPLPRGLIVLLIVAALTITIAGLQGIAGLIGPAFLALVLTVAVHPLRGWVAARGWPGWIGSAAGLIAVYLVLIGLTVALVVSVARFGTLLPSYEDEFDELVATAQRRLSALGVGDEQIQSVVDAFDLGRLAGFLGDLLSALLGLVSNLFFIVTLLLFMGLDAARFPERLRGVGPDKAHVAEALGTFASGTRRYLVVSTIFGLIVAVIDTGVLWLLGIPLPLLWGLLAFLTNYIPNIGFVIGLVPPAALALLEGGVGLMIAVIVAYSVINFVIQSVIQPKFVGDAVGLSGTITFLSLVFWAWVLGPLGALLAIPLTLLAKALLLDVDPSTRWVLPLLSGGPVGVPDSERAPAETGEKVRET